MIVDAHGHLGFDEVFDHDFTEDDLLLSQRENSIDLTLVQPSVVHDFATVRRYHDAVADLVRRHPGRFRGIADPDPHLPEYRDEVKRCVQKLGFAGIKLHPLGHAVNPAGRHGMAVFEIAEELGVPVMVHTGAGLPWAAPQMVAPAARRFPGLPIVLAHAGGMIFAGEAGMLARERANVYLECSWTGGFHVREWVREFGAGRIMFGSDHADNAAAELAKFRAAGLSEDELDMVLGGTAEKVFRI